LNSSGTRFDGQKLIIRLPMRFQRRGGRKRIVASDGSEIVPTSKPQPDGTLVKALVGARRWQKLLDAGVSRSRGLPDKCVEQLLCRECSA
jgi:hypothetical protein